MKFLSALLSSVVATQIAGAASTGDEPPNNSNKPFTYNETSFFLNDKPFQFLAGETEFQRIPVEFWRDRLKMIRAMGLNTVVACVFWNEIEQEPGKFDWSGANDINKFFKMAEEEGLKGLIRPGTYTCAEHEFGGFPYWLNNIDGMVVRSNNTDFLDRSRTYLKALYAEIEDLLAVNGGNILMSQVENELGFYIDYRDPAAVDYKYKLRDIFLEVGFDKLPLFTCDGPHHDSLLGGHINNTLTETDGVSYGYKARDEVLEDNGFEKDIGPWFNLEYYTRWLDRWGEAHNGYDDAFIQETVTNITSIIKKGQSFSLYEVHGGTSFGFSNGANFEDSKLKPQITSYDYGAPIDESGRPNKFYHALREAILNTMSDQEKMKVPKVPDMPPMIEVPRFEMKACNQLFDTLPKKQKHSKKPLTMERLNQAYGYTLYRHKVTKDVSGELQPGDGPRDRVQIFVNDKPVGISDACVYPIKNYTLSLKKGDKLDLFIENLGRVNFGSTMINQEKGIKGDVKVGNSVLDDWSMYSYDFADGSADEFTQECKLSSDYDGSAKDFLPTIYEGEFHLDEVSDTFLATPNWTKGVMFVNGNNLGRFWPVFGPQQEMYAPACWLQKGSNKVQILELEGTKDATIFGTTQRTWKNSTITN